MKKALLAGIGTAIIGLALAATPAQATPPGVPVPSDCLTGWYVNPDEAALLPKQTPEGLLFDGPGLVHHTVEPLALKDVTAGTIKADVKTGVAPLFKMETSDKYSTINVTADGKFWSSKIDAVEPGGQNKPVDKASDLIGKWTGYTDTTKVVTIGAGYGNDPGNTATVSALTFGGKTYDLTCKPGGGGSSSASTSASASASASASVTPSSSGSPTAGPVTTTSAAARGGASLPITGPGVGVIAVGAGALLAAGGVLFVLARRRKTTFSA